MPPVQASIQTTRRFTVEAGQGKKRHLFTVYLADPEGMRLGYKAFNTNARWEAIIPALQKWKAEHQITEKNMQDIEMDVWSMHQTAQSRL